MNRSPIQNLQSPVTSHQSPKIIVRAPNWVGDCVLATPFLKLLREKNPKAHITVLAKKPGNEIFEGNPNADAVWAYEDFWKTSGRLRREKFDLGYLLPNSFSSAFLFFLGRVGRRIGCGTELRSLLLTERLPWKGEAGHRVLRYCRLIVPSISDKQITPASHPSEMFLDDVARERAQSLLKDIPRERLIAINPCSNAPSRRWPAQRYAALAKRLITDLKAEVLLVGGPAEEDKRLAEEVEKKCALPRLHNLCGKTTLKSMAAVLKEAKVLVTSDTGIMHVAAAAKTPILALTGAGDMKVTGAWTEGRFEILNKHVWCSPCVKNHCINRQTPMICMESIEAGEVVSVVEKMVK